MTLRTISFGGGVQSMAMLVLAAQGRIDFRTFVFSNVGDDSEHPATLRYLQEYAIPYAEANGLELHVVHRHKRDGSIETLYQRLTKRGSRSLPIPVRMNGNGAPGRRSCTADFKIHVIAKWQRQHGATAANPGVVGIGISWDEIQRMRTESGIRWQVLEYPLIDLRLTREDCKNIIREAGLPVPPKSSCYFCPFHSLAVWQRMRHEEPELFWKSVELERMLNERLRSLSKDPVWFTSKLRPLDQVTSPEEQLAFAFDPEEQHSCGPFVCAGGV